MNHEIHERHESGRNRLRVASPLDSETEEVISHVIGAAIEVHKALGPGYLESIYKRAMLIELDARNLAFECERPLTVVYRGVAIPGQRVDLLVENRVVIELKAVVRFEQIHRVQVISCLHALELRAGLLINFRVPVLPQGLQRIVV